MNILNVKEFARTKNSDTMFILGCGPSLNQLSKTKRSIISQNDTISFNWYCLGDIGIVPRYYILDAQGFRKYERKSTDLSVTTFLTKLRTKYCVVIGRPTEHRNGYHKNLGEIHHDGIVVHPATPSTMSGGTAVMLNDISEGIFAGISALYYAIHIAVWMKYKRVVYVGIDLYDQSYYFDGGKQWWYLSAENMRREDQHPTAMETLRIVKEVRDITPGIEWYVGHEKSLLNRELPLYGWHK